MKNNFEQRKQNRIDYAKEQIKKNEERAESLSRSASEMASVIPMGQPVLLGHHSERADRNYRNKVSNTFEKSREADRKAEYYRDKLSAMESNKAISSDDPEAMAKIEAKIAGLESIQGFMKSANQCIRKKDKTAFLALEFGTEQLWEELNKEGRFGGAGFASYKLTNNNANIKHLKQRRDGLKKLEGQQTEVSKHKGVTVVKNVEANRIQLLFDKIPSKEVREKLSKTHRFRWCRSEGAWQRNLNNAGIYEVREFLKWFEENQQ